MCGFLGEISTSILSENNFIELLNLSVHRGPDQQKSYRDSVCQLGFNRLAILDVTENGMQPLISPSDKFVIVFNGEIYNYKELQHKYKISDSDLKSTSDSEIIRHLIEKIPLNVFAKELNGMFAIAIWDTENMQLSLIRDFSGIKPLYYGLSDSGIVFASQFDQIFKHPSFKQKELRPEIMKEFFGLGYMSAPNTVFQNIFQVEPGQYVIWDFNEKIVKEKRLYYNWQVQAKHLDSAKETREMFSLSMNKIIKNQLQSDVPIATFLSSGYDSSLVTAFSKKQKSDIKSFTFGLNDSELDESEDAKVYAEHMKVSHVVSKVHRKELLNSVDIHFKNMSEPFGDYSSVPSFLITKEAKKHATVMLSGDGGDELFWGYPRFRKSLNQAHYFKYPLWLRKLIVPFLRKKDKSLSAALTVTKRFSDWILEKQIHFTRLDALMVNVDFSSELYDIYQYDNAFSKSNVLQYLKRNEFFGHMQRTLRKVDLTSMANSLEVRVPFLDKHMIGFSNSIISEFTINHDRPKLILKDTLYQFIPIEKVEKQKKGFSIPIKQWLETDLKENFIKTVIDSSFYGGEHIDEKVLHSLLQDFYSNTKKIDPWGLWHLYAWQKWAINNDLV